MNEVAMQTVRDDLAKPWWQSKTIWINVVTLAVALVTLLTQQEWLSADAIKYLLFAVAVLNIILRWLTGEPITAPARALDRLRATRMLAWYDRSRKFEGELLKKRGPGRPPKQKE